MGGMGWVGQGCLHSSPPLPARPASCRMRSSGGGGGGQAAKDALGNDIKEAAWLKTHPANTRELAQGLKVGAHQGQQQDGGSRPRSSRAGRRARGEGRAQSAPCLPSTHIQGDPTYLVTGSDGKLEKYGINAVCTHLGCVVPWSTVSWGPKGACKPASPQESP